MYLQNKIFLLQVNILYTMRLELKTIPNASIISFNYQQKMIGVIYKWLVHNEIHDKISLYSFFWLLVGKMVIVCNFTKFF